MTVVLETPDQSRAARHIEGTMFRCCECARILPVGTSGGTGYAVNEEKAGLVCYDCCAVNDAKIMHNGTAVTLYLTTVKDGDFSPSTRLQRFDGKAYMVSNWPGTLKFPVNLIKWSYQNGKKDNRRDVWFHALGYQWHGVNIGEHNQVVRCKVVKG